MKKIHNKFKASASITTVIAVTGLLIVGGIIVVLNSVDLAKSSKSKLETSMAQLRARTCFEESLQKIKYNHSYTGTFAVTYSDGTCQAIVNEHGSLPDHKTVLLSATVNDFGYEESKLVDTSVSPFDVID